MANLINIYFHQTIIREGKEKKQLQELKGSPIIYNNCVSSCEVYPQSTSSSRKKKAES